MAGSPPAAAACRVAAALALLLAVAACASQPVSEAVDRPAAPASAAPASVGPSPSGSGAEPSSPASPSSAPATPSAATTVPPKPGNPTFTLAKETTGKNGTSTQEYKLTWTSPDGAADSFLVYGLTECLRDTKRYDGKPCVVRGMRIPADHLKLLATVPGDQRSTTLSWTIGDLGVLPYPAILLRATNEAGNSIFTIVHSENVCFQCTY